MPATAYDFLSQLKLLLDPLFNGEVYPQVLPENMGARFAATYGRIGSPNLDVTQSGPSGLRQERWQVSVWADNYDDAVIKGEQVISALNGVSGVWGTVNVGLSRVDDALDDRDDITGWSRTIVDFVVLYS
jgi:hypothetical protein